MWKLKNMFAVLCLTVFAAMYFNPMPLTLICSQFNSYMSAYNCVARNDKKKNHSRSKTFPGADNKNTPKKGKEKEKTGAKLESTTSAENDKSPTRWKWL